MRQTDYVILGLLGERPMSGYDIKKAVDIRFRFFWSESFGQIFPALKRLAQEGLIEQAASAEAGGHGRKLFRATPAGISALQNWLALPVEKGELSPGNPAEALFCKLRRARSSAGASPPIFGGARAAACAHEPLSGRVGRHPGRGRKSPRHPPRNRLRPAREPRLPGLEPRNHHLF